MTNAQDESWGVLTSLLPPGWQMLAFTSGSVSRLRGFENVSTLLRTLLMHVGNGYSLRETATRAKAAGLASVSDVALLERLRTVGPWWRNLCAHLLKENGVHMPAPAGGRVFRAVDGTVVKEPGKTGSSWRIHYTLRLPGLECDHFEITPARAEGGGETLARVPVRPGDCLLADRGFCRTASVLAAIGQGADVVVRLNTGNLPLRTAVRDTRFPLLQAVGELVEAGQCGEWDVSVGEGKAATRLRLCGVRKSEYATQGALMQLRRQASKQGSQLKPETLEYAKYVLVVSSLPATEFSTKQILEYYRLRWQIELAFKRLKSLAALGHLAKHDEQSVRSWLYGKLLLGLLTEKLIRAGRDISPWGYPIPSQ
jgi:hypothetical protein